MAATQAGHDLVDVTAVQLLGVGLFTVLAGASDEVGDAMVVVMWGIFILWLITHTTKFATMVKAL